MSLSLATKAKLVRAARLIEREPKTVLFVSPLLRAREIKMAAALHQVGWSVILLYKQTTPIEPGQSFDIAVKLPDDGALHIVAKALQPRLCHVFSGAVDELVLRFCRDKPSQVIIDLNDVFAPSLFNYLHERFEPTRECLAKADGLCARDLQAKFAERLDGYSLPPRVLLFPEYSWVDGPSAPGAAKKGSADEVSVVSVGTFTLETQGMHDSAYLKLARLLTDQKIHFHIYPHWFYKKSAGSVFNFDARSDFADFLELKEKTPYLHIHESLSLEALTAELPQYDFGIISGACAEFGQKLEFLRQDYMHACYSGRISDYLDARLPILLNREVVFNYWLLERYGLAIDLGGVLQPGFREQLLAIKRDPATAEKVEAAAGALSLERHAHRLARFYEQVIEDEPVGRIRIPLWLKVAHRVPRLGTAFRSLAAQLHAANVSHQSLRAAEQNVVRSDLKDGLSTKRTKRLEEELAAVSAAKAEIETENIILIERMMGLEEEAGNISARKSGGGAEYVPVRMKGGPSKKATGVAGPPSAEPTAELRALKAENEAMKARLTGLFEEITLGGMSISQVSGLLNWPEIVDDVERRNGFPELLRLVQIGLASPAGGRTGDGQAGDVSRAWEVLSRKNLDQLLDGGYANFKRTIALNYFTFAVQAGDPQINALQGLLGPQEIQDCWMQAQSLPDDPTFALKNQVYYRYLVLLLWTYASKSDPLGVLEKVREPAQGNPVVVPVGERMASQDLANSVLEYYAMGEGLALEGAKRVLEIGGGYGRNAFIALTLHPDLQYVMADIPPALYIAQRYLSSVFKDRKVFRARDFSDYSAVREEMESASIVFLLPHQLALIPEKAVDLTINISSFGEMTQDQIEHYFGEIERVTRGNFYTKQWIKSQNPFDGLVLRQQDYPHRPHWREVFLRRCPVQTEFFEALYHIGDGEA